MTDFCGESASIKTSGAQAVFTRCSDADHV